MDRLMNSLRELKVWQVGALVVVMLAAFGITYGVYAITDASAQQKLEENQRLIPVQLGNLVNEVAINGSIVFSNKETLTFGSSGIVAEILVDEGQEVEQGQPLVRLDAETVAKLKQAVAEAEVNQLNAEQALDDAKNPALQLAEAEADAADAKLALQTSQEELRDLLTPDSQVTIEFEAAVADAKLAVQVADDELDELLNPDSQVLAEAEAAVVAARIAVEDGQDALGREIVRAVAEANAITKDIEAARQDLSLASDENALRDAQKAVGDAKRTYGDLYGRYLGITLTDEEFLAPPDTLFADWGFDPEALEDRNYVIFPSGKFGDDPTTRWSELKIFAWLRLSPALASNTVLITCDEDRTLTSFQTCVERDFDDGWDLYRETQNDLSDLEAEIEKDIVSAEADIIRSEEDLVDARKTLDGLSGGPEAELLNRNLAVARATLLQAGIDLEELLEADPVEVNSKRNQVALAQANFERAEQDLTDLLEPDAAEVNSKRNQVALAQAALYGSEQDQAQLIESNRLEIILRETEVASAQATLTGAIQRYENSTLLSPFQGFVSLINVEEGEEVTATTSIVEAIDPSIVKVDGIVDEIDVLSLQLGSLASVSMDALPSQSLNGRVVTISSAASNQQGVVTFDVEIEVNVPEGVRLQEGLSAVANVTIGEASGLVIPNQAIQGTFDDPQVLVMNGRSGPEARSVLLGDSDGFWTVVEGGLAEGEQIVMEFEGAQVQQLGFRGIGGGGFRGGSGGGGGGGIADAH